MLWSLAYTVALLQCGVSLAAANSRRSEVLAPRASDDSVPIYRNTLKCVNDRVEDLLSRMTLEEKAGQMFHNPISIGPDFTLDPGAEGLAGRNSTENLVGEKLMSHFALNGVTDNPRGVAEWYNLLQQRALQTRLGIPISLSSDPRHHYSQTTGASISPGGFSQWPETLGFAALRDPALVRRFAEIAREEYMAVGLRVSLHPQVDLATEPRWSRIFGVWSEDAHLTAELIVEYIRGFHGDEFGKQSVSTLTKHFPGGGPQENGEDSHFKWGKNATYPGNNLDYHLIPFKAAIEAGARQMMPYYSRPIGLEGYEEVGFSFNKRIVTDLLREELGFQGIVVTDFTLVTDPPYALIVNFPAKAWGVEHLSEEERMVRILDAGCDQFGGEERPELLVKIVRDGLVAESRLDVSVRRLLKEKFELGLFDNPFVDPDVAERVVGNPYFRRLGEETQRRSYTLLTNNNQVLPLRALPKSTKIFGEGFNTTLLEVRGYTVVASAEEADLALLRLPPPFEPRNGTIEGSFNFHSGSLEYTSTEKSRQARIYSVVPTIVDIFTDRPIVIPEVIDQAAAVLSSYGSRDEAFLDIVFGDAEPQGRLPFDLPRSMAAVERQYEDVPFDTEDPVFTFGHGLRYKGLCKGSCKRRP